MRPRENFFGARGLQVLTSEARWVWGLTLLVALGLWGAGIRRPERLRATLRPGS